MMEDKDASAKRRSPVNLVFACSGAADVGEISDRVARMLVREKVASMCCTAAVAAQVPDIINKVKTADQILAFDGCEHHCAAKVLQEAGFEQFVHVDLDSLGMEKGKTPPTEENIVRVAEVARTACANQ